MNTRAFERYSSRLQRFRGSLSRKKQLTPDAPASRIRSFIESDGYLFSAYGEQYNALRELIPDGEGTVVEIGAGTGIGKTWIPELVCTDVLENDCVDTIVDATSMPFDNSSLRALVLKDALHHIPNVPNFLDEAVRCLQVGGAIVLCEPYWSPIARLVFKFLHPEPFDTHRATWTSAANDPWDSNQAMAWMVLRRDRRILHDRWPMLKVEEFQPVLGPSYLLSGGVFGRTTIPSGILNHIHAWERKRKRSMDPLRFEIVFRLTKTR